LSLSGRGGSVTRDAAQEVEQGFLDSAGAFERFEVDVLSAKRSAVDIDFLKLIEEQVRGGKPPGCGSGRLWKSLLSSF